MAEIRISFLLNDLVREMNSQADGLLRKNFRITYSQFVFLLCIGDTEDVDVTRLALALGVTKGAVSKRLGWFVNRNFVATHQLEGDAKRVLISLTKDGAALAEAAGNFLEKEFLQVISNSPGLDQDLLRTELGKMLSVLREKRSTLKS